MFPVPKYTRTYDGPRTDFRETIYWNGGVETRAVEQGLVENVLSEVAAGNDKTPTPGTPVAPAAGLAILEEWAAQHYAGVATMHIPRGIAQYLSQNGALKTDGSDWRTMVGSKITRVPSIRKAERLLGWKPKTDFKTGLKKTLDFYLKTRKPPEV